MARARLSAVYLPVDGMALKKRRIARKKPCQYDAKMMSFTVRN